MVIISPLVPSKFSFPISRVLINRFFRSFLIGLFVFLILSCMSCFYILEIDSLSVVSFTIIFSHSKGCLFTLFVASFAVQNPLSLIRLHLFICVFISIILGGRS